ncbi:MnhB domain-containing protein [Actinomycetospora cinnamomea]|uniref:Multisubunit sodium/proton antiporter MrpB subunit n=1 Tax=Actinomycetospora cinnamomea TaxID=663609 RepID=A0A2U1EDC9_9PSEU|nr:MnhB domain-containing protein [Actinomycetospora cinnamomea]PVY97961.1 multisubunit sodium/proton antiporter MrpB subunit [Actinomycetospora cinnamomea]
MTGPDAPPGPTVIVRVVARLLLAPSVVVAVALIVKGYTAVGDGFAAGMVVGLAVALNAVALGARRAEAALPVLRHAPYAAVGGALLALASGFFPVALGEPVFSHRPGPDEKVVSVGKAELMTAVSFDVGIFLLVVGVVTVLVHQLAEPDQEPQA